MIISDKCTMPVFSEGQEADIIFKFGELKSPILVIRWFVQQNPHIPHYNIPPALEFARVRDRFKRTNSTRPGGKGKAGPPVTKTTPEMVETVRGMILADQSVSIPEIALRLDCSYGTARNILRKKLKVVFN